MNGAGAASGNAAAVFRAGQLHGIAQDPEKGSILLHLQFVYRSVYIELDHRTPFVTSGKQA